MAPQFDRALRDLLRAAGCTLVRQGRGSHEIWHSPITKRNFAVPIGIPSRHTANAILRQAGLPKVLSGRGCVELSDALVFAKIILPVEFAHGLKTRPATPFARPAPPRPPHPPRHRYIFRNARQAGA